MNQDGQAESRAGNILKNSSFGLLTNVLPSILRLFSRYLFLLYFGDTLLGINSLFSDVIVLFSFAEIGIHATVSYFLYKPIAEGDEERIQSFLALYRKLNRFIIFAVTVVGLAFIPFLGLIKTSEPIPGLTIYYLIFLAQNIISYCLSYRLAYIKAAQKAYQLARINVIIAFATEIAQILATVLTKNFTVYLLTYLALVALRIFWTNDFIRRRYPVTRFKKAKKLDAKTVRLFTRKTKSLFLLRIMALGVTQTDSVIVSTMVDVTKWGYVSNYLAIKKIITLALSALSSGVAPSLGNLSVVESREKQESSFGLYSFLNTWLCTNVFACLVILVPPFIALVFGEKRVLDDLTSFLLFFNVLFSGLLEPATVLRDARGLYEKDKWINIVAFVVNLVTSVLLVWLFGLPGVFMGTLLSTAVCYARIAIVLRQAFGGGSRPYYLQAGKTIFFSLLSYALLHWVIAPPVWGWRSDLLGLVLLGVITVLVTNAIFIAANRGDVSYQESLRLMKRFLPMRKEG